MSFPIGGALPPDAPHYVTRQADIDLYNALQQGEFCYVFNARQMGKTSLQFKISRQLQQERFKIANLDLANVGKAPDEDIWYATLMFYLIRKLELNFDLGSWLEQNRLLSVSARWKLFLEEIILTKIRGNIIIFIDEIDAVLNLEFSTDDFFAVIRSCYNDRGKNPDYNRLTFCFLGVTRPSYLMRSISITSFNIGKAIELTGFTFQEARIPLTQGLTRVSKLCMLAFLRGVETLGLSLCWPMFLQAVGLNYYVDQAEIILQDILNWTRGQPFLTQKICELVTDYAKNNNDRNPNVEQIIQQSIIQNWRNHDDPIHLQTIENRIRCNSQPVLELINLYQKIRLQGTINSKGSTIEHELRLSGLVVRSNGHLRIYNRIYHTIFDQVWINEIIRQELAHKRPDFYIDSFSKWLSSDKKDNQFLLSKEQLTEFDEWINQGQELSKQDLEFLHASVKYQEKQAQQQKWRLILLSGGLIIALIISFLGIQWYQVRQRYQQQLSQNLMSLSQKIQPNQRQEKISLQLQALQLNSNLLIPLNLYRELTKIPYLTQTFQHSEQVNAIALSPDQKMILTGSLDGSAYLWNLKGELKHQFYHQGQMITLVKFNQDGKKLATVSIDGIVKIWDQKGQLHHTLKHEATVNAIAFTPDNNYLITASSDHHWYLWNLNTGKIKTSSRQLPKNVVHSGNILTLALSPTSSYFMTGSLDKTAKLWNLETGENLLTLDHQGGVNEVAFSHNGKLMATASADGMVTIMNLDTEVKRQLKHPSGVLGVTFSHDDKQLATISGNRVTLWDLEEIFNNKNQILLPNKLNPVFTHKRPINQAIFSQDNQLLMTVGDDNEGKIWDLQNHNLLYQLNHDAPVIDGLFLNKSEILTASWDQTVHFWNLAENSIRATPLTSSIQQFSLSQNNKEMIFSQSDQTIKLVKITEGKIENTSIKTNSTKDSIILSPQGSYIAVISNEEVQIWQKDGSKEKSNSWKLMATLSHFDEVEHLQFSPDEKYLATVSDEWKTRLWRIKPQMTIEDAQVIFEGNIKQVQFSFDSQVIGLIRQDNELFSFSVVTKPEISQLPSDIIEFSPNNQRIITYDQEKICLFQYQIFKQLHCQSFPNRNVIEIEWSPTGNYLAMIHSQQKLSIWKIEDDKLKEVKEIDIKKKIKQVQLSSLDEFLGVLTETDEIQVRKMTDLGKIDLHLQSETPIKALRFITPVAKEKLMIITSNDVLSLPLWNRQKLLLKKGSPIVDEPN